MRSIIVFFLFSVCVSCPAIAQSFVVQYVYFKHIEKDSTRIVSQNTFLNIEEDYSTFFSETPYLVDSIMAADEKLGKKINFKALPNDFLGCYIKKKLSSKELTYYSDEFDEHEFKYNEKPVLRWNIGKESKEILGFQTLSATVKYAGRDYKAYFTSEIPIQDGPYKFFGLPGLILEIFDEKNDHHFLAVGISKEKKISINDRISKGKYIETTRDKFIEMRKNHIQAPLKRMFELMNAHQIYEKKDANGNIVDMRKMLGETQKKMIEEYKKENKIEL
ncbi:MULTISPECIES: GLPGLI family protein [Chryseobacterium]|uniref:GLPGLI family protein n=1 Tax=Chryseobacterium taihuense TaxID=1141221 RepID=A0A4U8WNM9_9FLAO|nr:MULTISPECIES: GLPGLI family protein [Chryseobacterium]QQV02195.1 GLPGLI family protein [Chryseobacterium sp. FDAARGOS 1104]VFB04568.1 GLPGLI family protein [Chryseobacterium taihuense]